MTKVGVSASGMTRGVSVAEMTKVGFSASGRTGVEVIVRNDGGVGVSGITKVAGPWFCFVIPAFEPVSSKPPHFEYLSGVKHFNEQLGPGSL